MGTIENLYQLIEKENIILDITDSLPECVNGVYIKSPDTYPIIGINKSIENNLILLKITLAEELGHHFTSVGNCSALFNSYTNRTELNKAEMKAMKWATEFLLPLPKMKEVFLMNLDCEFQEILDRLEVTKDFLVNRLEFISKYTPFIELDKNTIISLTSLPKIRIITRHNIY